MSSPGQTVEAEEPLARVLEVAEQQNQEFVVVVRHYRPLGILSQTAMRLCLYGDGSEKEMAELRSTPVHAVLPSLPMLSPEMTLKQAAAQMLENRALALPVTDRTRVLLGILREDDILRTMAERLEE
jgi:CBS-domain-containing membrane protein